MHRIRPPGDLTKRCGVPELCGSLRLLGIRRPRDVHDACGSIRETQEEVRYVVQAQGYRLEPKRLGQDADHSARKVERDQHRSLKRALKRDEVPRRRGPVDARHSAPRSITRGLTELLGRVSSSHVALSNRDDTHLTRRDKERDTPVLLYGRHASFGLRIVARLAARSWRGVLEPRRRQTPSTWKAPNKALHASSSGEGHSLHSSSGTSGRRSSTASDRISMPSTNPDCVTSISQKLRSDGETLINPRR